MWPSPTLTLTQLGVRCAGKAWLWDDDAAMGSRGGCRARGTWGGVHDMWVWDHGEAG